jgi:hypothetical protein
MFIPYCQRVIKKSSNAFYISPVVKAKPEKRCFAYGSGMA